MTRQELEFAREALEFAREELRREMQERQRLEDKRQQRCDEIEQELVDSCLTTLSRDGLRLMSTRTFEVAITGAFPEYQYEVKRANDDTGSAGVERTLFGAVRECAEIIERGTRSAAKEEKTVDPWLMLKALGIAIALRLRQIFSRSSTDGRGTRALNADAGSQRLHCSTRDHFFAVWI